MGEARTRASRAVRTAPVTCCYGLVLLATTALLRLGPASLTNALLAASSTDVAHLEQDPVRVLLVSAGWLPGELWLPYALVLLLVAAPLERRIGPRRLALVFVSGHVLATLLTELPVAVAVSAGWWPPSAAHRLDVGASYGMLAVVTAFAGGLPLLEGLAAVLLGGVLVAGVPTAPPDMTTYGHALALVVGACWWPWLYRDGSPGPRRRRSCSRGRSART